MDRAGLPPYLLLPPTAYLLPPTVFASSLLVQDPLEPKFSNVTGVAFRWAVVQRVPALSMVRDSMDLGAFQCPYMTPVIVMNVR